MPLIKEELLHHIWQHRLFSQTALVTTQGESLQILKPGNLNADAGPDFQNARLKVNNTEWAGNVEIHIRTSDWLRHGHQQNAAYSNIVLHVVYEDDLEEKLGSFPTLELKQHISDQVIRKYEHLSTSTDSIPCGSQITDVPELIRSAWFETLLIGRLQRRSEWMNALVDRFEGDLEQAFLAVVFRAFGMKVNAEPFEQLAAQTPWKVLAKHSNDLFQLEAILFGNAGFLSSPTDDYQKTLQKEYDFLRHKYSLEPMDQKQWKFLRLRPANFPTLRLAQAAALFHSIGAFFHWFSGQGSQIDLKALLVQPSDYWKTHYKFGSSSIEKPKPIGNTMAKNIVINAAAPFLFVTAKRESRPELQELALEMLQNMDAEKNAKVSAFRNLGVKPQNAAETQSLIELKTNFCDHKKCLICSIGANILKRDS